ncbi:tryptophan 7-halogenase [Coleofasciculus sp.]|uniref:tryptophan 7-halogenase n=1 Tax=Coleofasciculus sp. TaxID=3100458 RepID=UPI003A3F9BB4
MYTTENPDYDVVIMGAGFAGVCQARHLLLKIPNIRVALIDPRPEERTEKDLKIGESTVEVSAMFLCRELGLYEYLIEHQVPKHGLNFHWPKDQATTDSIDDYYSLWTPLNPPIPSFQIDRAKLEQDLLKMNKDLGAVFYNGRVTNVNLTPADAVNSVYVKLDTGEIELKAKHIIDAAGRRFIIGRKADNLILEPENLLGLNTGSAWVRIKNVDRTIFDDGYDPAGGVASHYYGTNHFFGHGHWLWMIPIDKQSMELSIGVIHHHDVIPAQDINTLDKFYRFLEKNHNLLYRLVKSGEGIDFHYWPKIAHASKTVLSQDNWYVIGDAAAMFDAFYSTGMTSIAFTIETVTEVIRAKLAGEEDAEEKRTLYNEFNLKNMRNTNRLYYQHNKQLGNASIMSYRIYLEYMHWFGIVLPIYAGKWHLNLKFLSTFVKTAPLQTKIIIDIYDQLSQLVDSDSNIGLMNCYQTHQLLGDYIPLKEFDGFLDEVRFEPYRNNIFGSIKSTYFYLAIWYAKFRWKGFGFFGLISPKHIYRVCQLLVLSGRLALVEAIYKYKTKGLPSNSKIAQMQQEFKSYQYKPELQPWGENTI